MTESERTLLFQRKLHQLKEEETRLLKILKDVRRQLKKYEVEELQTCSESVIDREQEESDSDESIGDGEMLQKVLDCAKVINNSSLDLKLNGLFGESSNDQCEESEESD